MKKLFFYILLSTTLILLTSGFPGCGGKILSVGQFKEVSRQASNKVLIILGKSSKFIQSEVTLTNVKPLENTRIYPLITNNEEYILPDQEEKQILDNVQSFFNSLLKGRLKDLEYKENGKNRKIQFQSNHEVYNWTHDKKANKFVIILALNQENNNQRKFVRVDISNYKEIVESISKGGEVWEDDIHFKFEDATNTNPEEEKPIITRSPEIYNFQPSNYWPKIGERINLSWDVYFADSIILTSDDGFQQVFYKLKGNKTVKIDNKVNRKGITYHIVAFGKNENIESDPITVYPQDPRDVLVGFYYKSPKLDTLTLNIQGENKKIISNQKEPVIFYKLRLKNDICDLKIKSRIKNTVNKRLNLRYSKFYDIDKNYQLKLHKN